MLLKERHLILLEPMVQWLMGGTLLTDAILLFQTMKICFKFSFFKRL